LGEGGTRGRMLRVLAFDTSSLITDVAVCLGGRVLANDRSQTEERHAEVLLPKLQQCLAQAEIGLADIDAIAVGVGPGSFTGVRVGVATAKGLGLALGKPVIPVVSLLALAFEARGHVLSAEPAVAAPWVAPCLDAYKGELFAALYRGVDETNLVEVLPPFHAQPHVVREHLAAASGDARVTLVGPGVRRYPEFLNGLPETMFVAPWQTTGPAAVVLAELATAAVQRGEIPQLSQISPVYLRDSDAQLPKTPLRVS